ncbi:hypothetical protein N4599_02645 [Limosilactobacillus oris]|uniref:hypothetical protein n=1 Tax=Limosilactobacillus oris TaxID=1632 RepID=UPI0021B2055F|nr:hypothetical protein [Limosilactobacillus oris]UXC67861.1 hypothetical protein N4599_02645 [Limosilactobacillus oris]
MTKQEVVVKSSLTFAVVMDIAGVALSGLLNQPAWMLLTILGFAIAVVAIIWIT